MAASDYDGRLPEPPYDTDTSAVVALQEECDRLAEQVKLLREELEASKSRMEIAAEYLHRFQGACAYHGDQLVGAIKRIDATLEATKEGA